MHEPTGAIATFETKEDAKMAGFELELTEQQRAKLSQLNRHERRKWAAEERARQSAERHKNKRG